MKGDIVVNKFKIIKFVDDDFTIDVKVDFEKDTVWLTQDEMSILFNVDRTRISRHIANIYKDNELERNSTCAENALVHFEGKRKIKRKIKAFNLDMIISVGYRVKSKRGIIFRKWSTKVLKDYLTKGVAINEKKIDALNKTIAIQNKMLSTSLNVDEIQLANVIEKYTSALNLLDDYDHQRILISKTSSEIIALTYEDARKIIDSMKCRETSNIFGLEKESGKLDGIIKAINQTALGEDVYKSLEEKAANLLYFLVKDHPFVDGCKRIAATLFLEYLNRNNALVKNNHVILSNDAVCAITILAAESKPEEKNIIINVIMRMLEK